MLSILKASFNYLLGYKKSDEAEESLEAVTARLEKAVQGKVEVIEPKTKDDFEEGCFYKTGIVTAITNDHIFIDNKYICDKENVIGSVQIRDKVQYLAYQLNLNEELKVSKIISTVDDCWEEESREKIDEDQKSQVEKQIHDKPMKQPMMIKNIVARIVKREGRITFAEPNNISFDLNKIKSEFLPLIGDWVKINSLVAVDEMATDLSGDILDIRAIEPLRSKLHNGLVTSYDSKTGVGCIDKVIVFHKRACTPGYVPCVGDKVVCDNIESDQGIYSWRSLTVVPLIQVFPQQSTMVTPNKIELPHNIDYLVQNKNCIVISNNTDITLIANEEKEVSVTVANTGNVIHLLCKGCFLSKKSQSQLSLIYPTADSAIVLNPADTVSYLFKCKAKFVGISQEVFLFHFKHFKIARIFHITVNARVSNNKEHSENNVFNRTNIARQDEFDDATYIPGVRVFRPAPFATKTGIFKIPNKYWEVVLSAINSKKSLIECEVDVGYSLPTLAEPLTFQSYKDHFHGLLYLEEMGMIINMQQYDIQNTQLRPSGDYLVMEVPGLTEKRPSLIVGDKAIISFKWDTSKRQYKYEGIIHKTRSSEIYLKFNPKFHEDYNGEDCQVIFKASHTVIQRCHAGINFAVTYLGQEFLFPSRVIEKEAKYVLEESVSEANQSDTSFKDNNISDLEHNSINRNWNSSEQKNYIYNDCVMKLKTRKITWYNKKLNYYQKEAVKNILKGVARPLPYVIFGPPGTGKTITLCETILQILTVIPESRILIATPSNSSANLITERLLDSHILQPGDLVRLVAHHYFQSDSIPEKILPYCVTADLTSERSESKLYCENQNVRKRCSASVLGRHRITIGTCAALGILYNMGFPRGHFSHVVVDEAGQATEPEIMIPLNLIRSDSGQVILAGDPMQLGPVVQSNLANHFGLGESFLTRLLQQFPYQKDTEGFQSGYDPRLVTKLLMNYRSLPDILFLPNSLFYDSELQWTISSENSKEADILKLLAEDLPERAGSTSAIIFHGVNGTNYQDPDSPSWYNPEEATQVYLYFLKLCDRGIPASDIGIITPYRKQVSQIRELLLDLETEIPKVGSVEEFQGQERNIIILSTVRSTSDFVSQDIKHALGFLSAPQRLNVAITRARALLIIIGNPYLLSQDFYWRSVLEYCYTNNAYTGCNIQYEMKSLTNEKSLDC